MKVTRFLRSIGQWLTQPTTRVVRRTPRRHRPLRLEQVECRAMLTGTPGVSIGVSVANEGGDMYVTVYLSEPSDQVVAVTVNIERVGGASAAADWPFTSTSIWFAPWETGYSDVWASTDDNLIEADEDFLFSLSDPINAILGYQPSATTTVPDNDHVDLDNDANNNGAITGLDDPIEHFAPGAYVGMNSELERFEIVPNLAADYTGWHLALSAPTGASARIWETADKTDELEYEQLIISYMPQGLHKIWDAGEGVPTDLFLEATSLGQISVTLRLFDANWVQRSSDTIVFTSLVLAELDGDVDSDNTGAIDGTPEEDADEMLAPGVILQINDDDDNGNGTKDFLDPSPFVDGMGTPVMDNDLKPLNITIDPKGRDLTNYTLSIDVPTGLQLWTTKDKQASDTFFTIGTDVIPATMYIEGTAAGQYTITLTLTAWSGIVEAQDKVLVTVVDFDAVAYRPQTPPFAPWPVPFSEESLGVGIRRNGDDDDGDSPPAPGFVPDFNDPTVAGDDDLLQVDLNHTNHAGVGYKVSKSDTKINAFSSSDKYGLLLSGATLQSPYTDAPVAWLEWATFAGGSSIFEYSVWDATHGRKVFFDDIWFIPFTSVVVVLGGESNVPADPPMYPGQEGMIEFAIKEYRESGFDVYMYDEDAVDGHAGGSGPVYNMIVSAIMQRGITDIAIMGYSHGGGSTYELTSRLYRNTIGGLTDITKPFMIQFTAYVDAIVDRGVTAELHRPKMSIFHLNQYQRNLAPPLRGDAGSDDEQFDRTSLGVNHSTIDDHPIVQAKMSTRLREKMMP